MCTPSSILGTLNIQNFFTLVIDINCLTVIPCLTSVIISNWFCDNHRTQTFIVARSRTVDKLNCDFYILTDFFPAFVLSCSRRVPYLLFLLLHRHGKLVWFVWWNSIDAIDQLWWFLQRKISCVVLDLSQEITSQKRHCVATEQS